MPNLDFYAANGDFDAVLGYVFSTSGCRVFESYSRPGEDLREFGSIEALRVRYSIGTCEGTGPSVLLQLIPPSSFGLCQVRRVDLNPGTAAGHTFRYRLSGWGLIQLYLGGIGPHGMVSSHSNHFTQARALSWKRADEDGRGAIDLWDWKKIVSISSGLNRFIRRKLALYKLGSRPVLPTAAAAFETGFNPVSTFDEMLLRVHRDQNYVPPRDLR